MNRLKNWITISLFFILIGVLVLTTIKCSKLESENKKLQQEVVSISDSIKVENKTLNDEIEELTSKLEYYSYRIDSLKKVKQHVNKQEYVISADISKSVELLKENLKWE